MKAKTILDTEKKDAIDIATELCYSEEVKKKLTQAKSVYEIGRILKKEKNMIAIDTIVSIKSGDEYGGKYTGKLGIVKRFTDDRVGVEFAGLKNHASKYGLFWFNKENVTPSLFDTPKRNDGIIPADLAKAFLNFTFGAPRVSLGVKQVIFSGPKTIVFWIDGTKTIVSCGEGDNSDPYAGFCAAVTKRVFGSTSQAKKVLERTRKEAAK